MLNPFAAHSFQDSELEQEAATIFSALSCEGLSPTSAEAIQQSILVALASTGSTVANHRRFAFAASAMAAPLLIVGAASAATGDSPLDVPADALEAAASSVGLGGNSGDVREDFDARSKTAGDVGQPGSQPGNTANAPGLQDVDKDNAEGGQGPKASDAETEASAAESGPEANGPGSELGPSQSVAGPASGVSAEGSDEKLPPHENGKGCDDVLFAGGEPPFASPGGPVGCEVGNSANHRQNGVKQADEEEEEPADDPADEPTDAVGDDESQGGTSHGLGLGHEEDKPGNGNGIGHTKHEHDPNPNGHGPGGPSADPETGGPTTEPEAAPADGTQPASAAPGKSGEAQG